MDNESRNKIEEIFKAIYKEKASRQIIDKIVALVEAQTGNGTDTGSENRWNEEDILMITYGEKRRETLAKPFRFFTGLSAGSG